MDGLLGIIDKLLEDANVFMGGAFIEQEHEPSAP